MRSGTRSAVREGRENELVMHAHNKQKAAREGGQGKRGPYSFNERAASRALSLTSPAAL